MLRAAWAGGEVRHEGRHFAVSGVQVTARPTDVPLILGGNTQRALRRAAQLGDGWFSSGTPPLDEAVRLRDELLRLRREADDEAGAERPLPPRGPRRGSRPEPAGALRRGRIRRRGDLDRPRVAAATSPERRVVTTCSPRPERSASTAGRRHERREDDLEAYRLAARRWLAEHAEPRPSGTRRAPLGRGLRRRQRVPRPHRRRGAGAARTGDGVAAREVRRRLRRDRLAGRVRRRRLAAAFEEAFDDEQANFVTPGHHETFSVTLHLVAPTIARVRHAGAAGAS